MLCIYYNESKTINEEHVENHERINQSISFLKKSLPDLSILHNKEIHIYNNFLIESYLKDLTNISDKEKRGRDFLELVYSEQYLNEIKHTCDQLKDDEIFEGDTYFSNLTYTEVIDDANILLNVCYQIFSKSIKYAYCLIRPPSHHSSKDNFSGFCMVNQTFVTAKTLHDKYKKKVLILDYDLHHGDGTQKLVNTYSNDDIYFCSIHYFGRNFFPGTGSEKENTNKILNIPIRDKNLKDENYIEIFDSKVIPFITTVNPDVIVVSNGFDAHKDDPMKIMRLTSNFYVNVTKYLKLLSIPLVYILEGGYNPGTIGEVSIEIINQLLT